jgi:hypothetical protein
MIVGESARLTATITAPNGDVLPGPVEWATTNPTVATVDDLGNVTIVGAGTVQIVATYQGVAAVSTATIAPLQDAIQYATWTGGPFFASLFVQNGVVFFHHTQPNDPNYVNNDVIINYLSPGGPGSGAWQDRVQATASGRYQFQHYRTFSGCSQAAPCLDHADFFIAFGGWNGERLLATIVDVGGQLKFSVRPNR